jgi:hypothetical protein
MAVIRAWDRTHSLPVTEFCNTDWAVEAFRPIYLLAVVPSSLLFPQNVHVTAAGLPTNQDCQHICN